MVKTSEISVKTKGNCDVRDITGQLAGAVSESGVSDGIATVFCPGSTGGLTTIEFEPGLVKDLDIMFERLVPQADYYHHHETWHDDNGHSHVRAGLLGPSITVPFVKGQLTLGTWQQVVFLDFDTSPRTRRLVVQIVGE